MSKEQADQIRQEKNNINVEHTFELDESAANSPEHHIKNPIQTFEQAFRVCYNSFISIEILIILY